MKFRNDHAPNQSSSEPVDWRRLEAEIVAGLDVSREFETLGIVFTSEPNAKGIRQCHALGRKDDVPSAMVNVATGVYHDSGGVGETLHLFDFALEHADHGRWIDVVKHYARIANVDVQNLRTGKAGRIREAVYLYRRADGEVSYAVFRYRLPNGKKGFSQHPPDDHGGWKHGPGCMDGVEPLPYRLPELLATPLDHPVWVVEGEKDADRLAAESGWTTTTNHQGASSTKLWAGFARYFEGRVVYILPDNDPGGWRHAAGVAAYLCPVASSVRIVRLPGQPSKGDVSDWLDRGGDVGELIGLAAGSPVYTPGVASIEDGGEEPSETTSATKPVESEAVLVADVVESDNDPHRLARLFRDARYRQGGDATIRYWRGEWHRWDGAAYRVVAERELRAEISETVKAEFDRLAAVAVAEWEDRGKVDAEGNFQPRPLPLKVGTSLVANVVSALGGLVLLAGVVEPPTWLSGANGVVDAPHAAKDVLPARNGLVHLPSMLERRPGSLASPTPRYFVSWALDYDVREDAPDPSQWLGFLSSLWPEDPESIETLQEWFGYCLCQETRHQKMLGMIGPRRSGKGTISRVLSAMVGEANVAGPTLSGLATQFGLETLIGKPLAIIDDARLSGRSDVAVIVERLLTISGEGTITVDRKFQGAWTGRLPTRIVMISNELPRLSDASDALAGRFVLLNLRETFFGREDITLGDRLVGTELPGILLWSLEGLRRLRARGRFVTPKSSKDLVQSLEDLVNPIGAFLEQVCQFGDHLEIASEDLYAAWKAWCEREGRKRVGSVQDFGRDLHAAIPGLETRQRRGDGGRRRSYVGLALRAVDAVPSNVRKLMDWFPAWLDEDPNRRVRDSITAAGAAGLLEAKVGNGGWVVGPLWSAAKQLGWMSVEQGGAKYWIPVPESEPEPELSTGGDRERGWI